ncbi:protein ligase RNF181 [Seminavis robusta]|uniref:Protein ligase RNF181 n=1 Tax=Seminavis robusta TaxID=568900 RepID=A0A9N8EBJ7_9STRA|nr:protein ligase RNF181 [Seminavis robusta]|eukprot:Sro852_g211040.1 protein ligase RNF181 (441) ;mRNA; r:33920-35334
MDGSSFSYNSTGIVGSGFNGDSSFERFGSFDSPNSGGHGRDAYEFVAFLLWYLFLVLCCVIPTCCAYRRRRLVEARIAQQQASVSRIERQNLFILSSLRQSQVNNERINEQRRAKIAEKLQETTMTVAEEHILDISGEDGETKLQSTVIVTEEPQPQPTTIETNGTSNTPPPDADTGSNGNNITPPLTATICSGLAVEYDIETGDPDNPHALQIPITASNTTTNAQQEGGEDPTTTHRTVPGACAICLCPYEPGEQVTWSPREACQHVFHSGCIIPWLGKSDEPKCPCCRRDFCDPVPISQLEIEPMSLFAPVSFATNRIDGGEEDDIVVPHFMRALEASRLEFMASLELAAVEAAGRRDTMLLQQQQSEREGGLSLFDASPFEPAPSNNTNSANMQQQSPQGGSPFEIHGSQGIAVNTIVNTEGGNVQQGNTSQTSSTP